MKIAHESPISLFNEVQKVTDIDYCLVHLLEENKQYLDLFVEAVNSGREVILDTSIFELGEAFDSSKFATWVERLKPTWYIIPDVLEDSKRTQDKASEWIDKYDDLLPGKRIGVVQGKDYDEIVECYDYGRFVLLSRLLDDGVIEKSKPHHLLGCSLPQEGLLYSSDDNDWSWIYSIDSSNPIVHGLKDIRYGDTGLRTKESTKLFTLINEPKPNNYIWLKNVLDFRDYWNIN